MYATAMMVRITPKNGKKMSAGLLAIFSVVMVKKSNTGQMFNKGAAANYWFLAIGILSFVYAVKQATEKDSSTVTDQATGSAGLYERVLTMASTFNSILVMGLLFAANQNFTFGSNKFKGSGNGGLFMGGAI